LLDATARSINFSAALESLKIRDVNLGIEENNYRLALNCLMRLEAFLFSTSLFLEGNEHFNSIVLLRKKYLR